MDIYIAIPNQHKFYNVKSYREMPTPGQLTEKERSLCVQINNYGHFHEYSKEEAIEVFTEAGLEVIQHRWNNPINFFILRKIIVYKNYNTCLDQHQMPRLSYLKSNASMSAASLSGSFSCAMMKSALRIPIIGAASYEMCHCISRGFKQTVRPLLHQP